MPVPDSATERVAFVESLIRMLPVAGPAATAVKTTGIVQVDPENPGTHVPPLWENGPEKLANIKLDMPAAPFVTVRT